MPDSRREKNVCMRAKIERDFFLLMISGYYYP